MSYGLYISAEGAYAQGRRVEALSNNLANVDTVGFKRDLALFQARYSEETQRGLDYPGSRSMNDLGGGVLLSGIKTDFSPGTLRRTDIPTDMAVGNDAFFTVRRDDGDFLTRAGNFMFDSSGHLVTQDNHAVLDDGGQPIQIDPDQPWQLSSNGSIVQDGSAQKLGLVRPHSAGDLVKVGENLFRPLGPTEAVDDGDRHVNGGMLEQSDVKPASEMIELIEASRAFEANLNMIKNHDEMLSSLTSRVLKSS